MITEVRRIQRLGGFELVNWISNSEDVKTAPSLDKDICKDLNLNSSETVQRVLGLSWNPNIDHFCFHLNLDLKKIYNSTVRPTKRQILQQVMSVFDPLGLIVNLTIRGRILLQDIWKSGIGWDDSIDEELHDTWTCLMKDLAEVAGLTIPRCYSVNIPTAERIEMHVFCDASKKAYAAAAYLRTIASTDIEARLILAKARVASTKSISIPRLELQAALLGSRIAKILLETLEFKIHEIYLWTDSTTVLHWIKGDAGKLGQFESHRIGEIQESTNTADWHWIPSKMNAADNATRTYSKDGSNPLDFKTWLNGPDFLYENKSTWPKKSIGHLEEQAEFTALSFEKNIGLPNITRFSKWSRLLRTTAWIMRFGRILLKKHHKLNQDLPPDLSVPELDHAKKLLLRECQLDTFTDELQLLQKKKPIANHSRLKKLSPMLNEDGLIALSGRTSLSPEMDISAKHPVILPANHRLTYLVLQNVHEKCGHHGIETVLNEVRKQYWVIDGRSAVKTVFRKCQRCRVMKAKPVSPVMGQLPACRVTASFKPFTYTGMDYFGPLFVTVGRRTEKRWGVPFTCLSIRAIHLEVAYSLTTDSAIMAIRRMIARRGQPQEIYSDNGTNFRGAAEEMKRALKELDQRKINETMTQLNITWKFLPPGSPHMAGVWERMIRTVKNTFKVIMNGQTLRDELLLTFLVECENIVNSRPLTKVSVDPDDLESLTPNHFLLGGNNNNSFGEIRDLRNHWRRSQKLADYFWKRWIKEYLPTLNKHSKWNRDSQPVQLNDIVIIVDENAPRKSWKLGKIEAVFPGPDKKIRVVDVKTANGTLRRPVHKLCRIDTEM